MRARIFGVVLGAAIGSAALIGALLVGDSVRGSLRERALERIGTAQYLLEGQDRTFSDSKETLEGRGTYGNWGPWPGVPYSLGLHLLATASAKEGGSRANRVNLYGVRSNFWEFSPAKSNISVESGNVLLNEALALQLGV